jgi:hypothetical protein
MNDQGRRIYIHEHALTLVARSTTELAYNVPFAMAATRAVKLINHYVSDQGVEFGLVRPEVAHILADSARRSWDLTMTDLLRSLVRRRTEQNHQGQVAHVLTSEERVEATCSDSGYLTFATSSAAAQRMYADTGPIRPLAASLNDGTGPSDLTIVRGRNLAFFRPHLGVGLVSGSYFPIRLEVSHLSATEAAHAATSNVFAELVAIVTGIASLTSDESRVLGDVVRAVRRSTDLECSLDLTTPDSLRCG